MAQNNFDYLDLRNTGDELLQFFGMDAVLRRDGSPDRPCRVAITNYMPSDKPGSLDTPTDRQVFLSALTPAIQETPPDYEVDQLVTFVQPPTNPPTIDEILPFTSKVKPYKPAGIVVLYESTVRG
jgi:hypothetical protein